MLTTEIKSSSVANSQRKALTQARKQDANVWLINCQKNTYYFVLMIGLPKPAYSFPHFD